MTGELRRTRGSTKADKQRMDIKAKVYSPSICRAPRARQKRKIRPGRSAFRLSAPAVIEVMRAKSGECARSDINGHLPAL